MKKNLLTAILTISVFAFQAQVIFNIKTPPAIAGNVQFTNNGDGSNWGLANLLDTANSICDTLVLAMDGTPGVNPQGIDSTYEGCNPIINTSDVAGKIAVIYRNNCSFGDKALNAQNAGAIGVVIINREPGLINMNGTAGVGSNVTIPVTFVDNATGAMIRQQLDLGETVTAFIGNKSNFFQDDIGLKQGNVLRSPTGMVPALTATNNNDFSFKVGAWVHNHGSADQTNVTLSATVNGPSGLVYNETSTVQSVNSGDSIQVLLTDFSLPTYPTGKYTLEYTSDLGGTDQFDRDNKITTYFNISDSLLAFSTPNDTSDIPVTNTGFRAVNQAPNTDFTHCIHYQSPIASRLQVDGIYFNASGGSDGKLTGEFMELYAYEWNNVFSGIDDAAYSSSNLILQEIGSGSYDYVDSIPNEWVYAKLRNTNGDKIALEDNQRYLFCVAHVSTVNEEVFFGYQSNVDYALNSDIYHQPMSPVQADLTWNANGFGFDPTPGMMLKVEENTVGISENYDLSIKPYPNPANDRMIIPFNTISGPVTIQAQDIAGALLSSMEVTVTEGQRLAYDVSKLANGNYIFTVLHKDGKSTFKVSIQR